MQILLIGKKSYWVYGFRPPGGPMRVSLLALAMVLAVVILCVPALRAEANPSEVATRYWIFFKDKGRWEQLNAAEARSFVNSRLTLRAIRRRMIRQASRPDKRFNFYADLPVEPDYVRQISNKGLRIHCVSKWFNAVSVVGASLEALRAATIELPFVRDVRRVRSFRGKLPEKGSREREGLPGTTAEADTGNFDYGPSLFQNQFHRIVELHGQNLSGKGILIGVFDTGFNLEHPALQPLAERVVAEYDFVQGDSITRNQANDSPIQDEHGTAVLSILGGFEEGKIIGPAYGASFVLAKTENIDSERHVEEDNWAAAAEWADSLGVDIVSSSLGYSEFDAGEGDYTYQDLDGETTIITQAANFLASRGVLVVNSAGNEGNKNWYYILPPADGKFVLAVGAVDANNTVASFSSHGPTFDGRVKPDIMGFGVGVYGAVSNSLGYAYYVGTSGSCPLASGTAALLLEQYPQLSLAQLLNIMRKSGDNQPPYGPDNDRGWGTFDAVRARQFAGGDFEIPSRLMVFPNYPNPFSERTFLKVRLPEPALISVRIYNLLGQLVRNLNYPGLASDNFIIWDGKNDGGKQVSSGVYLYQVKAASQQKTGKLILLRNP